MDQVSRALPDFLWLDRMEMNASMVNIQGKAFTTSSVANFIENLDGVKEFQEPVLKNAIWHGQVYDFQISFNYTPVSVARSPEENAAPRRPEPPARPLRRRRSGRGRRPGPGTGRGRAAGAPR
jgi:Tfp pilus assembly protein PilN